MKKRVSNETIVDDILDELANARNKFSSNEDVLPALTEEVGELNQSILELKHEPQKGKTHADVYKEAIQVAVMAIRVASEGDPNFTYDPLAVHAT